MIADSEIAISTTKHMAGTDAAPFLSYLTSAFPKWWGIADVVLAFVLAAMVFAVMVAAHGKINRQAGDATYRTYRILNSRNIRAAGGVLRGRRTVHMDQLSNRVWLAWLVAFVCVAVVVHRGESACG